MAYSVNSVTLLGYLGKDAEVRSTSNGGEVVVFSLATSESWKVNDERKERTEWHRVASFDDFQNRFIRDLKKGERVIIEGGSIQTRKWTDEKGTERYVTEVIIPKFKGSVNRLNSKEE